MRRRAMQKLEWLEAALAREGGPFLLGDQPSIADAAFIGFLTRLAHNYKFFKAFDARSWIARGHTPRAALSSKSRGCRLSAHPTAAR